MKDTCSLALLVAALLFTSPVSATPLTFNLFQPNAGLSGFTGPFANVTIDLTSASTADVEFSSLTSTTGNPACTGATPCTYLMGDGFTAALNVNATAFSAGPVTEQNSLPGFTPTFDSTTIGSANDDGFGAFNFHVTNFDGYKDTATSVKFTLTNSGGTWSSPSDVLVANPLGWVAAAHIFVNSGACSGACVSGDAAGDGTHPHEPVPEPGTWLLFTSGFLLVAAGAFRKPRLHSR